MFPRYYSHQYYLGPQTCPHCDRGQVETESGHTYECPECNGTGIQGNPQLGFWFAVVFCTVAWLSILATIPEILSWMFD